MSDTQHYLLPRLIYHQQAAGRDASPALRHTFAGAETHSVFGLTVTNLRFSSGEPSTVEPYQSSPLHTEQMHTLTVNLKPLIRASSPFLSSLAGSPTLKRKAI